MTEVSNNIEQASDLTVQARGKGVGINNVFLVQHLARAGMLLSSWWSPSRDMMLRNFWKTSDHLAGAIYTMTSKMSAIPIKVVSTDKSNRQWVKEAEILTDILNGAVEFGDGWVNFYSRFVEDLLTQDNGSFAEVIGFGEKDGPIIGTPVGLANLDAARCTRTGDPTYPVVYEDMSGARYKLHTSRIIFTSQMPSPIYEMYGVGFCLVGDSVVRLANGTSKKIRDIVNERYSGEVESLDENGNIVGAKIVGWYKNKRGERGIVNIRGKYSQSIRGKQNTNSWVTEDHPVLTPDGWKNAGDLRNGDKIIGSGRMPNRLQMEFLVGTLLGDGHLSVSSKNALPRFSVAHCKAQEEWFNIKDGVLSGGFSMKKRSYLQKLRYKGEASIHEIVYGQTKRSPGFVELYNSFYDNKKKVFPEDLVREYASPLMLATWYMDDGNICDRERNARNRNPHARISTNGYTVQEVERMVSLLNELGYESTVISARGDVDKRNIRISVKGSRKFFDDIAPYVPDSMRYKIPHHSKEYDPEKWNLGESEPFIDEFVVGETWDEYREYSPPEYVYCIDVEKTHNFITANLIVHNCAVSRCSNVAQTLVDVITYKQEKLGSRPHRQLLITKGGLDPNDLQIAFQMAENAMDAQGLSRYSKVVVGGSSSIPEAGLDVVELSSLPDGFTEETSINYGMAAIALALGMDARELFPAMQSGATRADALLQHLKQRGKGPGQILQVTKQHIDYKFLPTYLKFESDYQDDAEDRQIAEIRKIRADSRVQDLASGVSERVSRVRMVVDGDVDNAEFEAMELEDGRLPDGTPSVALFYSKNREYSQYLNLGVDDPLDIKNNNQQEMLIKINENRRKTLETMVNENDPQKKTAAKRSHSALIHLEMRYLGLENELPKTFPANNPNPNNIDTRIRDTNPGRPTEDDENPPDSSTTMPPEEKPI